MRLYWYSNTVDVTFTALQHLKWDTLFTELDPHIHKQDGLDNHLHHLCAIIVTKYVTLRLHHKANTETQKNIDEKIQNYFNRLATNKHQ